MAVSVGAGTWRCLSRCWEVAPTLGAATPGWLPVAPGGAARPLGAEAALSPLVDDAPMLTTTDERQQAPSENRNASLPRIPVPRREGSRWPWRPSRSFVITAAIGVVAAVLYTWGLSSVGWANSYYAA